MITWCDCASQLVSEVVSTKKTVRTWQHELFHVYLCKILVLFISNPLIGNTNGTQPCSL